MVGVLNIYFGGDTGREGQEISTKEMQKLVQALPQFQDQIDKLSLHIHVRQS